MVVRKGFRFWCLGFWLAGVVGFQGVNIGVLKLCFCVFFWESGTTKSCESRLHFEVQYSLAELPAAARHVTLSVLSSSLALGSLII